jgi:hypothetical protein
MKKTFFAILTISICFAAANAQRNAVKDEAFEASKAVRQEMQESKQQMTAAAATLVPADFADPDSFGKNAKFLGSLYAGTLYIYKSCDPTVLLNDLGVTLAADDKCVVNNPAGTMPFADVTDPAWQITIPGRTVDNVIYPIYNHNGGWDIFHDTIGSDAQLVYAPYVIVESAALNDPAAINPNTGLPMAGSWRGTIPGFISRSQPYTAGTFIADWDNHAAVPGRGFSRSYWASLGLPQNVINNIYRMPMTLKFGIRARTIGPVYDSAFYYTVRLFGN